MALLPRAHWYCVLVLGCLAPSRRAAQTHGASISSWSRSRAKLSAHAEKNAFAQTIILTIEPEGSARLQRELARAGLSSEVVVGYNGAAENDMSDARALLKTLGYTDNVHWTFSVPFACIHMSPHHYPDLAATASELWNHLGSMRQSFDDMLATDSHRCVAKVAAIAASHAQIWRDLADHRLPKTMALPSGTKDDDAWFLILEDDVEFCPHWLQRLQEEIHEAPADADMLKLSYFGHWREEDVPSANKSSPFLEAKNTMDAGGVLSNCIKDLATGKGFSSMPCTGFYAGNQAYLLKRRGAQKILDGLRGQPFQDIDVTIMDLVKTYVWRRVLAVEGPGNNPQRRLEIHAPGAFLQVQEERKGGSWEDMIPKCNQDPAEPDR